MACQNYRKATFLPATEPTIAELLSLANVNTLHSTNVLITCGIFNIGMIHGSDILGTKATTAAWFKHDSVPYSESQDNGPHGQSIVVGTKKQLACPQTLRVSGDASLRDKSANQEQICRSESYSGACSCTMSAATSCRPSRHA